VPTLAEVQRKAAMRLRPSTAAESAPLADSITMVGRFRPTTDRNGDTVAGYLHRFFSGRAPHRVMLSRGYVRLDTLALEDGRVVLRWRAARPAAGDTAYFSFSLRAVDRQGIASAEVYSGYGMVLGPPDSIALARAMDSVTMYRLGTRWHGTDAAPIQLAVGDTFTICVLGWWADSAGVPPVRFDLSESADGETGVFQFAYQGNSCTHVTALRHTTVPPLPGQQAYTDALRAP